MSVAGVAHPVERHLAKVEVASSSLVIRSKNPVFFEDWIFFICCLQHTNNGIYSLKFSCKGIVHKYQSTYLWHCTKVHSKNTQSLNTFFVQFAWLIENTDYNISVNRNERRENYEKWNLWLWDETSWRCIKRKVLIQKDCKAYPALRYGKPYQLIIAVSVATCG